MLNMGNILRAKREKLQLSIKDVSNKTGLSIDLIQSTENGEKVNFDDLNKIQRALSIQDIRGGVYGNKRQFWNDAIKCAKFLHEKGRSACSLTKEEAIEITKNETIKNLVDLPDNVLAEYLGNNMINPKITFWNFKTIVGLKHMHEYDISIIPDDDSIMTEFDRN